MSRGRESPRFWWGQTSVNTDTFFSEAAHPHTNPSSTRAAIGAESDERSHHSTDLPARHDAITVSSPAGVHPRPSKPPEAELVPLRGSQVFILSRNDGRVLDLHPTRRKFLVSDQDFPSRFLDSFLGLPSKAFPPRFTLFTTQLTMG